MTALGALALLVGDARAFLLDSFEKEPRLLRAGTSEARLRVARSTPTAKRYARLLEDVGGLHGVDVQASVFDTEVSERRNLALDLVAAEAPCERHVLMQLMRREGATLQVHQPQRFVDSLVGLCEGLERELGCLVGANAYLTPCGAQGLAPHYDDVEVFVLHCHGAKRWRVYAPLEGHQLPRESSGDLSREALAEPLMDVVLRPGDLLYLPRGTPHEALAQKGGDGGDGRASVHVTLSAMQKWTVGDLAAAVASAACEQPLESAAAPPLAARRGLPPGAVMADPAARVAAGRLVAAELRRLADEVERAGSGPALHAGLDFMAADFMQHRLPPAMAAMNSGPPPDDWSRVRAALPAGLVRLEGVGLGGESVRVVTCLGNDRTSHMMPPEDDGSDSDGEDDAEDKDASDSDSSVSVGDDGDGDDEGGLWVDAEYATAAEVLLGCTEKMGMLVKTLPLPDAEDRTKVARQLWSAGLLLTVKAKQEKKIMATAKGERPAKRKRAKSASER